jgi:hypothetical protein
MKTLFLLTTTLWDAAFKITLELIHSHIKNGDEIHIVTCGGELHFCLANNEHSKIKCSACRLRFKKTMQLLKIPNKNITYIKPTTKNIKLPQINDIDELKNLDILNLKIGPSLASCMISKTRNHKPNIYSERNLITQIAKASVSCYETTTKELTKQKYDRFYIFNGRYATENAAIKSAEKLNAGYYTYEFGQNLSTYVLFKNTIPHDLNRNKKNLKEFWDSGLENKVTISTNWFHDYRNSKPESGEKPSFLYTTYQTKNFLPKEVLKNKNCIAIFNSSLDEYESMPGWDNLLFKEEYDAIHFIVTSCTNKMFVLRIHPNLSNLKNEQIKQLKKLEEQNFSNLLIIWPKEKIDSYALMDACEKVITLGSTIGVEACFWGKVSILLGRSFYEDLDCCYKPKNKKEIITLINSNLKPHNPENSLPYAYWRNRYGHNFEHLRTSSLSDYKMKTKYNFKEKIQLKFLDLALKFTEKNPSKQNAKN